MHSRLRVFLAQAARKSAGLSSPSYLPNPRVLSNGDYTSFANVAGSSRQLQSQKLTYYSVVVRRGFSGYAVEQFSDDEYDCDYENHPASSSVANIDEWKWKLSIEIYGKVVVTSKVPLPNYRPDLDDKRPQREVVIPLSLQRRVEGLLQEHLDRTIVNSDEVGDTLDKMKNVNQLENVETAEHADSFLDGSVMEKVLQRRSLRMRNMQRAWQESPEGRRMLDFRKSLPAFMEKERLLQAIARNQVVVISGETGCGKTTQLPQYILESEIESGRGAFCSIICTQPRRISAMAVAERVSAERGEPLGESDLLPRRRDLRLILMSATLNADLFSSYFGEAPMIHIPGFTYPVRAHFLEDILEMTGYKLTSFNQVDDYGQEKMWKTQRQLAPRKRKNQITNLVEIECGSKGRENHTLVAEVFILFSLLWMDVSWKVEDISCLRDQLKAHPLLGDPNRVLLLTCHGSMATSEQKLIFEKPPPNVRKIILATNMAEASITINDIVFVVDCGKAKETTYDALNNTPCLLPSWISQASARQRRGRAGRVPGECYHLYPRCVFEAFAEYQLPELLRTPLNSLCLQIKSLEVESIGDFLSAALQPPESLAVQNAVDFLKMIGALDENENLTHLGKFLTVLPVDPKLGKMLIMGAIMRCFDPILTIVAGLSVRDPFLLPQDKKDLAGTAKSRFSAKDYSDHMALVRAYEGWKDADREGSAYEYCWRNFLSVQTLQAIHSLRKQFTYILKDAGLLDTDGATNNRLSHNQSLVRAVICSGLFPGIASVVHRETSMSFKTMDDGQVLLCVKSLLELKPTMLSTLYVVGVSAVFQLENSVNARYQTIQYPWLVFGEKVKVNTVFIRDSTGVSDSILILFGGKLYHGATAGNLKMLEGYIDFFMDPSLAECYVRVKEEIDKLIQKKLQDPSIDIHKEGKYLMHAVQELVSGDQCEGRFVFGRESKRPRESCDKDRFSKDGTNPKSLLQTLLMRAGHSPPKYKTKHLKTNEFRALVEFKGMQFVGKPKKNKVVAEKDAAIEALAWLTHTSENNHNEDGSSPPDVTDNMLKLLGRRRRSKRLK
ncbi:UNVERIFIED_CONTAM: DExH-box ATP-dependent RNA helicase DExH3 [Sesamum latifolium]|uniref:RNA helicase n=1 Tax=Sesamum latifolium TaxID=2727402 RepID=A0AAW2TQ00_9LAMI